MRVVFWHNIISPHQSSFLRALAATDSEVVVVTQEKISKYREQQGWRVPEMPGVQIIIAPSQQEIGSIINQDIAESIHVIAGARGHELGHIATHEAIRSKARIGILSESPDATRGITGPLRLAKYSIERLTVGKNFDFIMAMGQLGVRWFTRCGYPVARVFPFGYFTESQLIPLNSIVSDHFRIIFVGRCIPCKGIDTLLNALKLLNHENWELVFIGDGPLRLDSERMATSLGIGEKVKFLGQLEWNVALGEIAKADLLVLPSRYDGWGAVVNEALQCGVPVVCSDQCGASDLLHEKWRGDIFTAGSVEELAHALQKRIADGKPTMELRKKLVEWATCIDGMDAAEYFNAVLKHIYEGKERPSIPWG